MLNPFKNARGLLANAIYSSYSSPTNSPGQRGERNRGTSTSSWSPPSTFTWTSMTWTTSSTGRWPTGSKHLSNTTNLRNFLVKTEFGLPTTLRTDRPGGTAPFWRGAGGVHKVQFVSLKSLICSCCSPLGTLGRTINIWQRAKQKRQLGENLTISASLKVLWIMKDYDVKWQTCKLFSKIQLRFVSHCATQARRETYVKKLKKLIQVWWHHLWLLSFLRKLNWSTWQGSNINPYPNISWSYFLKRWTFMANVANWNVLEIMRLRVFSSLRGDINYIGPLNLAKTLLFWQI